MSDSFQFTGTEKALNRKIAKLAGVQAELSLHQHEIEARAQALLASHHKTGEHQITTSEGKVDHYVNLEGPAALSIEEGHFNGYKGKRKYVEGLHVLTRAAGLRL